MITLNYIGSKKTLKDTIFKVCRDNIPNLENYSFADLFAGTGVIGHHVNIKDVFFKNVISNDFEVFSYVINKALLKSVYSEKMDTIIKELNDIEELKEGLIYQNYSDHDGCERMFFTNHNAKKCDTMRMEIDKMLEEEKIDETEHTFLLASLIASIDKYANTSSIYGAYLKKYKKSAEKKFKLKPIHTHCELNENNEVYNKKIEDLVTEIDFDVVYLDPPYNHRQYGSNYSPLNYIAKYDENIVLTGKTGLIKGYNKSDFCSKQRMKNTFEKLIEDINCKYLLLSYNNEGILKQREIKEILMKRGDVKLFKIIYNKFKAQMSVQLKHTIEYLWFVDLNSINDKFEEIEMEVVK